jgi:hypothetical protein
LALLEGLTPDEAADRAGVSRTTAWRWRRGPKFQKRLERARSELLRAGMDRLTTTVGRAIDTLKRNLDCGNPTAENMAAGKLIEAALKYREQLDLAARLTALESRLAEPKEAKPWA